MAASSRRTGPRSEWRPASSCRRSTSGEAGAVEETSSLVATGPPRACVQVLAGARQRAGDAGRQAVAPGDQGVQAGVVADQAGGGLLPHARDPGSPSEGSPRRIAKST